MTKPGNLAAGSVLGRYELVLHVASGGMGQIWAARIKGSRGFQKLIALKTFVPDAQSDPNFEQMFLDEAALAARIKHPNVVQVMDLGEEEEVLFQVMEWIVGESLHNMMRAASSRGGVPLDVAARIIYQVSSGLHAAHELKDEVGQPIGLVHRDVSPQSILLTTQGIAKVIDFGVAKFAGRTLAQTQIGELKGKVPYMAPEHIRGQAIDRRADVFALGLLLYQLISGEHPFLGETDKATMSRLSSALPAIPLRKKVPSVSEDLSRLVAAALEKNPDRRVASALDLMQRLERVLPDSGQQSSNDRVAAFLKEVVGPAIDERDLELRDALKKLESRSSLPSIANVEAQVGGRQGAPTPFEERPTDPAPPASSTPVPELYTPAANTPSGVSRGPAAEAAPTPAALSEEQPADLAPPRRAPLLIAASVGVFALVFVILVARPSSQGPLNTLTSSSAPATVAAAAISAASTAKPPSPSPSTSASANPAEAPAAGTSSSSAASPSGAPTSKPSMQKGTNRPREFTPGGL